MNIGGWVINNAVIILFAFVIVIIIEVAMIWKKGWDSYTITLIGITTLACVGVFAAITVDNERNGPAIFGLLGTLGGYLIGRLEGRGSVGSVNSTPAPESLSKPVPPGDTNQL
jgi:hypothetical protein